MKKILSKALIINTTLFLAACNTNANSSSDQDASKSKTEIKKQSQISENSDAKANIPIDSKIKTSHSKWLSDKFLKNELKTFAQYNNLYKKWIKSSDGKDALQKAYELSDDGKDEFNTKFNDWKKQYGQQRDIAEFKTEMSQKDSEAYSIYKEWATSDEGKEKIKTTFNGDSDVFDDKFEKFQKIARYWKTSESYINSDDSLNTYQNWRQELDVWELLKPLFKNSGNDYRNAYDSWKEKNYRSKEDYILDSESKDNFDDWRLTNDGIEALKPLYKAATRQNSIYQTRFREWKNNPNNIISKEDYYDSPKSTSAFRDWIISPNGIEALKQHYIAHPSYLNNFNDWKDDEDNIISRQDVVENSGDDHDIHQAFDSWRVSLRGKNMLAEIFKNSNPAFTNSYEAWRIKQKNLKLANEYAKDSDSDDDFDDWKDTTAAKNTLKGYFENSDDDYTQAYDKWKKTQSIKSEKDFWNDDVSNALVNEWLKTNDGRTAVMTWITKPGSDRGWAYQEWKKLPANAGRSNDETRDDFLQNFLFTGLTNGNIGEYAEKFAKHAMTDSRISWKIRQSFIRAILLSNVNGNQQAQEAYNKWFETNRKTAWDYSSESASNQIFNDWIKTQDGRTAILLVFLDISNEVDSAYNDWQIIAGNENKTKKEFKNSGWEIVGKYAEIWAKSIWNNRTTQTANSLRNLKHLFASALVKTRGEGDKVLKDKYNEWKYKTKTQYKASSEFEDDALNWADWEKNAQIDGDVINAFTSIIESSTSSAHSEYNEWKMLEENLKSENEYKLDPDFKEDAAIWAEGKMKSDINVKRLVIAEMDSTLPDGGDFDLAWNYDNNYKFKKETDYQADDDFASDLYEWADINKLNNNDIKDRFVEAIVSTKTNGDDALKFAYNNQGKFKSEDEYETSDTFAEDAVVFWAVGKLTTNDQVQAEFIRAITTSTKTNGDKTAKDKFDRWKVKDPSIYEGDLQYGLDASSWAIGKRQDVVKPEFKKALDGANDYRSGGHQAAKHAFEIWRKPKPDDYKSNDDEYIDDIKWYIDNKNGEDKIQSAVEEVINLPDTNKDPKEGNDILKDKFIFWKPLSKDNFLKTKHNKDAILAWKSNAPSDHVSIRQVISNVLNDKQLASKTTGNSEFISSLKKISQRAYEEYLARN